MRVKITLWDAIKLRIAGKAADELIKSVSEICNSEITNTKRPENYQVFGIDVEPSKQ